MSLNTLDKIPFFKKRPVLTAICGLLVGLLAFTILNLDKVIDFKIWLSGKDVTITVLSSVSKPATPPLQSRAHSITYQVLNTRKSPLVVINTSVIDWKTKKLLLGYKFHKDNNEPIKFGESRSFTLTNSLLMQIPNLGKNGEVTQGLKIDTNFKTYYVPIEKYFNYLQ